VKTLFVIIVVLGSILGGLAAPGAVRTPYEGRVAPQARGQIDALVFGRLRQLNLPPARLCSDAVFVRRA
jgi:hypothetical protein